MNLEGKLADFPLPDVLTFLNMGQKTGVLEASSGSVTAQIYLEDGEVIQASSSNARLRLSAFLAARGLLTESAAQAGERRARAEKRPFRTVVIESGLVDPDDVKSLEKILCGEIAFEAMRWRDGRFTFQTGEKPDAAAAVLRIGVQNLILEGVRRLDEASRFEQEARVDRNLVVTMVCATGRLESEVVLTPREWGIISLINGKRTLDEILTLSPAESEGATWVVLERLRAARLIQLHAKAVEEPDPLSSTGLMTDKYRNMAELALLGPPPAPPAPEPAVSSETLPCLVPEDTRLISGDEVTTSFQLFGARVPARLVGAPDTGVVFELLRPVLTVGRAESNDIVLLHQSVSKHHAQLVQDAGAWRITDLGSTNGTQVNGMIVDELRLTPGDTIRFGAVPFTYDAVVVPFGGGPLEGTS